MDGQKAVTCYASAKLLEGAIKKYNTFIIFFLKMAWKKA